MRRHIARHPDHSLGHFLKRTVSAQLHLLGVIAAAAGLAVLIYHARAKGDLDHTWACVIFGVTGILVFSASTLYHFINDGYVISARLRQVLQDMDHFAIYLFIAGSYTPFLLNAVLQPWRAILITSVWVIGLLGIVYTHMRRRLPAWAQHRLIRTGLFLAMGWAVVFRLSEAVGRLTEGEFALLLAGAAAYTFGAFIYAFRRPNLVRGVFGYHELWHVMVLVGFTCHYFLILDFYRA